ncbi:hypothetical protein [uncultured Tateyamaria sp.]|uniref:hypothetical protein n=1 Tax=uncultured Tateyamaria sp. TaxID=455651 RepID=UPI00261D83EB|nr:hypothetical protein [uncultured Tateyamaria sp.]
MTNVVSIQSGSYASNRSGKPRAASMSEVLDWPNVLYLGGVDAARYRVWFPPRFALALRDRFQSPEQVAAAFNVRISTAWNWWNGDHRASGDIVMRLVMSYPDLAIWFAAQWRAELDRAA